jgi:ATP-binding cassette subfamily B protein
VRCRKSTPTCCAAAGAASRLNELLNAKPDIAPPARPMALPTPPRGALRVQNVTFRYPTRPDAPAVIDFDLTIEPGETVRHRRPLGRGEIEPCSSWPSGSTTRRSAPSASTAFPLVQADPAEVRRRMALVPQEGTLFAASARDNLRYGNWDASEDGNLGGRPRGQRRGLHQGRCPKGSTPSSASGCAPVGWTTPAHRHRPRAAARRADPAARRATSALDAESERLVQQALERLMEGRTTLVIAHRLATVRKADRIVVMDYGRIVEQGKHARLSAAGGLYARLAALQFDDFRRGLNALSAPVNRQSINCNDEGRQSRDRRR